MIERRYKRLIVPYKTILDIFCTWTQNLGFLKCRFPELPSDVEIIKVDIDMPRDCFVFLIYHASFPIINPCEIIPALDYFHAYVEYNVCKLPEPEGQNEST